jgi:hypothetical protein
MMRFRSRSKSFWDGFVSGLSSFVFVYSPPHIEVERISPEQALAEDWRRVGGYLWSAIDKVDRSQETGKKD